MKTFHHDRKEIIGIDLARFLCALSVMLSHYLPVLSDDFHWAKLGGSGVAIFFVISGYIIPKSSEGRSPFAFIKSRIVRLAPAVWVCSTITMITLIASAGFSMPLLSKYLRTVFFIPVMLQTPGALDDIWVDGVYWTLFVEIAFYAVMLCMLCFNAFERIAQLAFALGLLSLAYWSIVLGAQVFFPTAEFSHLLLATGFKRYFDLSLVHSGAWFGLGINIWLLAKKRDYLTRMPSFLICLAGGLLQQAHHAIYSVHLPVLLIYAYCFSGIAFIFFSVFTDFGAHASQKTLKMCRWVGLTTYPLYLVHNKLGMFLVRHLSAYGIDPTAATFCIIPFVVAAAFGIAYFIEPVLQEKLRPLLDKARPYLPFPSKSRQDQGA